jgi:hypothetical protein
MDEQIGLPGPLQLTTKGMYKLPPLPLMDWHFTFTLFIL